MIVMHLIAWNDPNRKADGPVVEVHPSFVEVHPSFDMTTEMLECDRCRGTLDCLRLTFIDAIRMFVARHSDCEESE